VTIEVSHVSLTLGNVAVLHDVSCTIARGRVTAIIGPNGAGKTSLVRVIAGLVAPGSGNVTIGGKPLSGIDRTDRARSLGYLPQIGLPQWNVTARALISLGRLPHRSAFAAPTDQDEAAIVDAMHVTDTTYLADRTIDQMSGGERARIQMARVLAGQPDWILADEPLANLDPPHARDMLHLCRNAAKRGSGVIIVLHQLDAAAEFADDVIIMREGVIIAAGASAAVLTPQHLETAFDMRFDVFTRARRRIIVPFTDFIG
jgi:iron complex transport system ATP-binding protein